MPRVCLSPCRTEAQVTPAFSPRGSLSPPREAKDRARERLGWTAFIAIPAASLPTAVGRYERLAAGGTRLLSPLPAAAKTGRTVPASRQPSGAGARIGTGPAGAPSITTSGLRQSRSGSYLLLFTRGDASRWLAGSPVGSSREVPQPRGCHKRWLGDKLTPTPGAGSPERGTPAATPFVQGKAPGAGSPAPFELTGTTFSGGSGCRCTAAGTSTLPARTQSCTAWRGEFSPCNPGNVLGSLGYRRFLPVPGWDPIFIPDHIQKMHLGRAREMSSVMGNPRGESQCCSTHRLMWEAVGLRSLGTKGKGRAGKNATAGTTSSPVHKTNISPSSLPLYSCGPGIATSSCSSTPQMGGKCDPAARGTLWTSQDAQDDVRCGETIRHDRAEQGSSLILL